MFGSEVWTVTSSEERKLNVWEHSVKKDLWTLVKGENDWRITTTRA